MCAASSPVKVQSILAADRIGRRRIWLNKISIRPDRFLSPQADPGTWVPGPAPPATLSGVRLHEAILRLRNLTGDSGSKTIPADLLRSCPGLGDFGRRRSFPGPGNYRADTVAAVCSPDTVSAFEREGHPHSHDRLPARRRPASHPGGDSVPAAGARPLSAGGPQPRHLPRPQAASGGASPL